LFETPQAHSRPSLHASLTNQTDINVYCRHNRFIHITQPSHNQLPQGVGKGTVEAVNALIGRVFDEHSISLFNLTIAPIEDHDGVIQVRNDHPCKQHHFKLTKIIASLFQFIPESTATTTTIIYLKRLLFPSN
jgi:hypothetical protein